MPLSVRNSICRKIEREFASQLKSRGIFPGDALLVAVSAGIDSTVLAHLSHNYSPNIHFAHVNYGLRSGASVADEIFCRSLAERYHGRFHCYQVTHEIKKDTANLQAVARELRYTWFEAIVEENDLRGILTGHHFDDHVETITHQFLRGGGPDTLTGFFNARKHVIRPLMGICKDDIRQYADAIGIAWRDDESNASEDYTRNRIRHKLLPALREYNKGLDQSIIHRAKALHQIIDFAEMSMNETVQTQLRIVGDVVSVDGNWLHSFPHRELFMRTWLKPLGITEGDLDSALRLLTKNRGELILNGGRLLRWDKEQLQLMPEPAALMVSVTVTLPMHWQGDNWNIECIPLEDKPNRKPWAIIDAVHFSGNVILRNWRPADRFVPKGMKGSKKIGDFLTHLKVPLSERKRVMVLERDGVILAVLGYRLADCASHLTEAQSKVAIYLS